MPLVVLLPLTTTMTTTVVEVGAILKWRASATQLRQQVVAASAYHCRMMNWQVHLSWLHETVVVVDAAAAVAAHDDDDDGDDGGGDLNNEPDE